MIKNILLFSALLFFFSSLSAEKYEFFGAIKLYGKDEASITYKLVITETNGKLTGYSLTDVAGPHETKNIIEGTFDSKTNMLVFKEKDIVYTKSPVSGDLFCFVNFEGKVKLRSSKPKIDGNFKGMFKNKAKCIDGTITLVGSERVQKLLSKVNNKIQKSKEVPDSMKVKYNPVTVFDSMQVNHLMPTQNISIFDLSSTVSFEIWDKEKEDGDVINLYHNGKNILTNFAVTKQKKKIDVILSSENNVFMIEAVNEGKFAPNTAMILFTGNNPIEMQSNLRKGETTSISIVKRQE